jgi:hypothetical protein
VNELRSLFWTVRLTTPPPDSVASPTLLLPSGSTDAKGHARAGECLDAVGLAELRKALKHKRQ